MAQSPKNMEREQRSLHLDVSVTRVSTSDPHLVHRQPSLPALTMSLSLDPPTLGLCQQLSLNPGATRGLRLDEESAFEPELPAQQPSDSPPGAVGCTFAV